ncbi:oxygenase MpaB family protein [Mumia sp. DW29H23]|uniref:oxygenase MpaB family protein n=1 Tax=Mumia sp. DW29H23 TaxID=3421241 RepID=UPI003D691D24
MTTLDSTPPTPRTPAVPSRFREAEERGARIAKPLRLFGRVTEVDEDLMERIGAGFLERDEVGHRLADAMRMRAGEPGRVAMREFAVRLADPTAPAESPALADFFAAVEATPDWVNLDLIAEAGRVQRRFGRNAADVLLQLSLIGGYRFGGPTDLLVATGGLTGEMTRRRLAETQKWAVALAQPDALLPYGEGWRLTVHVRAMHALVNHAFERDWDVARWGLPINQTDQAATLGLFDGVLLIGVRALGVPVTRDESRAVMHLWKYVGWLMGVDDAWLVDDERERHRLNYHLVRAQADISDAGPQLAQAITQTLGDLPQGAFRRERTLSMLTAFLGVRSMHELGLPVRPPWATAATFAENTVRYRLLGRGETGRRRLQAWGDRVADALLRDYYGGDGEQELGTLR